MEVRPAGPRLRSSPFAITRGFARGFPSFVSATACSSEQNQACQQVTTHPPPASPDPSCISQMFVRFQSAL